MGFFKSVGKALGFGGPGSGAGSTQTQAEQVDPRLKEIRDRQLNSAKDYRANMTNLKAEQGAQAEEGSRQNLAKSMADVKTGMNQRGLLYSGLKQGAQQQASIDEASALASQRAQINNQIEDQANALDSQALGSAYQVQGMQQDLNDAAYKQALLNRQNQFNVSSSLGGAVGSLIGGRAGS